MNFKDVYERFKLITGFDEKEASKWIPVCKESMEYISSRLKPDAPSENSAARLCCAAAALAGYKCRLYLSSNDAYSFKLGDITVNGSNKSLEMRAETIWKNAKADISDLILDDGCFAFSQVTT